MHQQGKRLAILFLAMLAAGCGRQEAAPVAGTDPVTGMEMTGPAPAAGAQDAAPAAPAAAGGAGVAEVAGTTRACMIAGEFELMGQRIRSRDCLQASADVPEPTHRQMCESLAQTSAQMGGKAGELTYMDACPRPSQGSCKGLFGQASLHAFYYERSGGDLASLPDSCRAAGGTWEG